MRRPKREGVELSPDEVQVLIETYDINDSELEDIEEHNPDLAAVIHKLLKVRRPKRVLARINWGSVSLGINGTDLSVAGYGSGAHVVLMSAAEARELDEARRYAEGAGWHPRKAARSQKGRAK